MDWRAAYLMFEWERFYGSGEGYKKDSLRNSNLELEAGQQLQADLAH
jgi:hypothetical protein